MAISKFTGTSASGFASWLNSNKTGTFLEDCTITDGEPITITKGDSVFSYRHDNVYSQTGRISFTNGKTSIEKTCEVGNAQLNVYYSWLCNNGLFLRFWEWRQTQSSSWYGDGDGSVILYCNDNNKLSAIIRGGHYGETQSDKWNIIDGDSPVQTAIEFTGDTAAASTILINPNYNDGTAGIALPHIFIATQSNYSETGLSHSTMNEINYITSGKWFIEN